MVLVLWQKLQIPVIILGQVGGDWISSQYKTIPLRHVNSPEIQASYLVLLLKMCEGPYSISNNYIFTDLFSFKCPRRRYVIFPCLLLLAD